MILTSSEDIIEVDGSNIYIDDSLNCSETKSYTYQVQVKNTTPIIDIENVAVTPVLKYMDRSIIDLTDEEHGYLDDYSEPSFNGIKLTIQGKEGYLFNGEFFYKNNNLESSAKVSIVEQEVPFKEYTVTYTDGSNTESFFKNQVSTVNEGSDTPEFKGSPIREGYTFEGWNPTPTKTVSDNATYVAQWKKVDEETPIKEYTVTYTDGSNTESFFKNQVSTVNEGSNTPEFKGSPVRDGYTFEGWNPTLAKTVSDNATYVAQWKKQIDPVVPSNPEDPETPKLPETGVPIEINGLLLMLLGFGILMINRPFTKRKKYHNGEATRNI